MESRASFKIMPLVLGVYREEDYACPLMPRENWLEMPIRAGDEDYPLKSL
jgi:hypothetical protein